MKIKNKMDCRGVSEGEFGIYLERNKDQFSQLVLSIGEVKDALRLITLGHQEQLRKIAVLEERLTNMRDIRIEDKRDSAKHFMDIRQEFDRRGKKAMWRTGLLSTLLTTVACTILALLSSIIKQ